MRMIDGMTRDDVLSALGEISNHFEECAKETYGYCHQLFERWMNAADWAAAYLNDTAPTAGGWISVKDRLPDNEQDVLAYLDNGEETRIAPCNYANGVWFDCTMNCVVVLEHVTYWMPLPSTEGLHET